MAEAGAQRDQAVGRLLGIALDTRHRGRRDCRRREGKAVSPALAWAEARGSQ